MKNTALSTLLLALLAFTARSVFADDTNEFRPLPKLSSANRPNIKTYIAGTPSGNVVLGNNMRPDFVVQDGRIVPYTNNASPKVVNTNNPTTTAREVDEFMKLSAEAQQQLKDAMLKLQNLREKQGGRIRHVQSMIARADQQPAIKQKILEVRKLVHDYISKNSPADIEALEVMTEGRDVMEHNGQVGSLIY
jgi:hypothetical protein